MLLWQYTKLCRQEMDHNQLKRVCASHTSVLLPSAVDNRPSLRWVFYSR